MNAEKIERFYKRISDLNDGKINDNRIDSFKSYEWSLLIEANKYIKYLLNQNKKLEKDK